MSISTHDVIIAGGSVAGAALGWALARQGARVLLVEPEPRFRDRVRGESIHAWGVAEAARLGLLPELGAARPREVRSWNTHVAGQLLERRDLPSTTVAQRPGLNVHHPELQEALLSAAVRAGCELLRGERVTQVGPGAEVRLQQRPGRLAASLLVLADGRGSGLAAQLGLRVTGERSPLHVSGVLLELALAEDATQLYWPAELGAVVLLAPLTAARTRLYLAQAGERYSGEARLPALLARAAQLGVPADWLARARPAGPLAAFETQLARLEPESLPRAVVAIGDAAGCVDPVFGCGLSMALRDARCLSERIAGGDLQLSAAGFAHERSAYHAALLRVESWLRRILYDTGADPAELRAAALARLGPLGIDLIGLGPDTPSHSDIEAALFAPA
jgi:2-polyprenyl-6-methoxyphenol hydroxylase-like FAD-dependent oxidoreductase